MRLDGRTPILALILACILTVSLAARLLAGALPLPSIGRVAPTPTGTPTSLPTPTPSAMPSPSATPTATATPMPVRVLRSYPIDGDSDVPAQVPLRFVFDQPMDTRAGAVRVVITPSLTLQVEWPAPDTLLLQTVPRQPETHYQITLRAARSRQGGALAQPLSLSFSEGGRGAPIPILMYHHVDVLQPDALADQKEWTVAPADFVAQMDLLAQLGAHVVPLGEAVDYLEKGEALPARPVVLTFDDGNSCLLREAIPDLQARHWPATLFIPANYAEVNKKEYLNWTQLKSLVEAGFALGGHSFNHAFVGNLSPAEAERQFGDERRRIAEMTGAQPKFFSYPFGTFSARTVEQLQSYGYRAAVTIEQTVYQKPSRLWALGRIRMGYGEPLEKLRAKLPWGE